MQRVAQLEEAVVGDIHHVVDGAQTDGYQAVGQPGRGRTNLHAADAGGGVERADFRCGKGDVITRRAGLNGCGGLLCRVLLEGATGDTGQLARHAPVTQQVGTVRRDFQLENGISGHKGAHGSTHGVVLRQNPQPVFLVRQPQLRSRAEHTAALDTAQLAVLDFPAAGQHRPGQGAGHFVAHFVILCAADNLAQRALPGVYHADVQVVTALHGCLFHDLSHNHEVGGHAALLDTLHLNTGKGEHIGHLLSAETLQVDVA